MNKTFTRSANIWVSFKVLLKNIFIFDIKNRITLTPSLIVLLLIAVALLLLVYRISEVPFFYIPMIISISALLYIASDYLGYYIMRRNLAMYKIQSITEEECLLRITFSIEEKDVVFPLSKIFKIAYQSRIILGMAGVLGFASLSMRAFILHYHDNEGDEKEIAIPLDFQDIQELMLFIIQQANLENATKSSSLRLGLVWEKSTDPHKETNNENTLRVYTIDPQSNIAIPFLISIAFFVLIGYLLISQGII